MMLEGNGSIVCRGDARTVVLDLDQVEALILESHICSTTSGPLPDTGQGLPLPAHTYDAGARV